MLAKVKIQKITKIITSFSKFVSFINPYISDLMKTYITVHLNSIYKNISKLDFLRIDNIHVRKHTFYIKTKQFKILEIILLLTKQGIKLNLNF